MADESKPKPTSDYTWKPWKIVSIAVALLLVVAGGLINVASGGTEETPVASAPAGRTPTGGSALVPGAAILPGGGPSSTPDGEPPAEAAPEPAADDNPLSPAMLRGGLSFFVGLAVAFALRSFLKIGLFFLGLWLITLFLLAQAGWVEIHWDLMDDSFARMTSRVGEQFESMRTFITGSLPSAGMAGLGLVTGLRKR